MKGSRPDRERGEALAPAAVEAEAMRASVLNHGEPPHGFRRLGNNRFTMFVRRALPLCLALLATVGEEWWIELRHHEYVALEPCLSEDDH